MQDVACPIRIGVGMLLRKIVFSGLIAFFIVLIASEVSFDFENYSLYADRIEAASERFSAEPVFPLFLLVLSIFELSSELIIQIFMMFGALFIIYSLTDLANKDGDFGIIRSLIAIGLATPFIIFSVIVPRQGLAIGIVLLAMTRVIRNGRFVEWRTVGLLFLAAMTHGITALLGAGIVLVGYSNIRKTMLPLIFLAPIGMLSVEMFRPDLLRSFSVGYEHYIGNMRETGVGRLILFSVVAIIYLALASRRVGGFFAATASRNLVVALSISLTITVLYFFVATDAIRLAYFISIMMIAEVVRRLSFSGKHLVASNITFKNS